MIETWVERERQLMSEGLRRRVKVEFEEEVRWRGRRGLAMTVGGTEGEDRCFAPGGEGRERNKRERGKKTMSGRGY